MINVYSRFKNVRLLCGPKEIRTPNPLVANEVRYRCAMGPSLAIIPPRLPARLLVLFVHGSRSDVRRIDRLLNS